MSGTSSVKRKRSLQDLPVDLTIMQRAKSSLLSLQKELEGIEETTEGIASIMTQIEALQNILRKAKKPVRLRVCHPLSIF